MDIELIPSGNIEFMIKVLTFSDVQYNSIITTYYCDAKRIFDFIIGNKSVRFATLSYKDLDDNKVVTDMYLTPYYHKPCTDDYLPF